MRHDKFPLPGGGKRQTGLDVVRFDIREVSKNVRFCHACCKIFQDVIDGDPQTPDTGLAPPFPRFYCNAFVVRHIAGPVDVRAV